MLIDAPLAVAIDFFVINFFVSRYFLATGQHLEDDPVITIAHAKLVKGVIDSTEYVAAWPALDRCKYHQRGSAVAFCSPLSPRIPRTTKGRASFFLSFFV